MQSKKKVNLSHIQQECLPALCRAHETAQELIYAIIYILVLTIDVYFKQSLIYLLLTLMFVLGKH